MAKGIWEADNPHILAPRNVAMASFKGKLQMASNGPPITWRWESYGIPGWEAIRSRELAESSVKLI